MNDAWQDFLAHTAFAYDENTEVGGCHLQGDIQRTVQIIAVSNDLVGLFYLLQITHTHNGVTKLHIFFEITAILADFLRFLRILLVYFDEQEAYARPNEFA